MDKGVTLFCCKLKRLGTRFIIYISVQNNLGSVSLGAVNLDKRCRGRHYDNCLCTVCFCGICNALCMISRRCGYKSLGSLLIGKSAYGIVCASELVCSGKLHILRLKVNLIACHI